MVALNQNKGLSIDEIEALFIITPETGDIWWKERGMGRVLGRPAGCLVGCGHRKIGLRKDGKYIQYYAHHIIWAWVNGKWPETILDHINGIKDDNRIDNLRAATHSQNRVNRRINKNNKSGRKWVCKRKNRSGWNAAVWFGETRKHKYFPTKEAAHEWAAGVAQKLHGEFYNPGDG